MNFAPIWKFGNSTSLCSVTYICSFAYSLQDEMFQKFNFDTEWAVRLISKITNDEDLPIEGDTIVKQVSSSFFYFPCGSIIGFPSKNRIFLLIWLISLGTVASSSPDQCREILLWYKKKPGRVWRSARGTSFC